MFAAHRRRWRAGHLVLLALIAAAFLRRRRTGRGAVHADPVRRSGERHCGDSGRDATGRPGQPVGLRADGRGGTYARAAPRASDRPARDEHRRDSGAALTYNAGAVKFKSAVLYRSWTGSDAWGLFTNRSTSWDYMWTTPYDDRCSSHPHYGCTTRGTSGGRFVAANRLSLVAGTETTNGFNLSVLCDARRR